MSFSPLPARRPGAFLAVLALLAMPVLAVGPPPPEGAVPTLDRIYQADQEDGRPYSTPQERTATDQRARRRIEQVTAIVSADGLRTAEDYYRAAIVFQHGDQPQDFLTAHLLATIAGFHGHAGGRWLSAASFDMFLLSLDRPQVLGTIYGKANFSRYDRRVSDHLREEFCVPPVGVQEANEAAIEGGHRGPIQRRAARCETP